MRDLVVVEVDEPQGAMVGEDHVRPGAHAVGGSADGMAPARGARAAPGNAGLRRSEKGVQQRDECNSLWQTAVYQLCPAATMTRWEPHPRLADASRAAASRELGARSFALRC